MSVPALAAGGSYNAVFNVYLNAGCGTTQTFTVEIDPSNTLLETNELDNVYTTDAFIQLYKPNLVVSSIALSTSNPRCLLAFDVTATIVNQGPASTGRVGTLRMLDHVGETITAIKYVTFPAIPPHSSTTVTGRMILGPSFCGETHRMVATVDYNHLIDEFDEDDNGRYINYTLYH